MVRNDEKNILKIIKYTPPFIIMLASIFITLLLYIDYNSTLKNEKKRIQAEYVREQKLLIKQNVQTAVDFIETRYNKMEIHLKTSLQKRVANAKVIAQSIYEQNKNIKTKTEILQMIKDALRKIRFNDGRGHIFIHHRNGVNVLHPILPNKEGVDISQNKDKNGVNRFKVVQNIIKKQQKGFATFYLFDPQDVTTQQKKIVYAEKFEPYNLIFGTGEYLKDFEQKVKESVLEYFSTLKMANNRHHILLSFDGTFLIHPNERLLYKNIQEEKNLLKLKPLLKDLQEIIPQREAFYSNALSIHPKTGQKTTKLFFVKTFPKWKWFVSMGFYLDDIQSTLKEKKNYLEAKYKDYLHTMIISSFIITIILLIISFYVAKILERKFFRYKRQLKDEINENIKQKTMLKKAQEVAKIGDWELNLETMEATWSEQILKIFGIKEKPINIGPKFLKTIMHPDDWSCFGASLQKAMETGEEHHCNYRIIRPNGDIRWIDCRGQVDLNKQLISGVIQDITDNKMLELEKHQKEELLYQQSKMAAMGEMLGNIAHQWRQPLSTISTASTGMKIQKELGLLSDDEFNHSMDAINKSAQYLSQTIEDFRNFYKSNKDITNFLLKPTIEKALSLMRTQCIENNIQIIDDIENSTLNSLENELLQVLINLLNNAKDALILRRKENRFIFITTSTNEDSVVINILDNAEGIKEEILSRIFEPYFTTKHQSQGTGIGLYMCEEIVVKHLKGSLNVKNKSFSYKNKDYKGAEFTVSLPLKLQKDSHSQS